MKFRLNGQIHSLRDLLATAWWIALIVGIGFAVAFHFVQPAPPKRIVMTTGSEGGAYYHFASRYAAILATRGIALEVRPSAGSLENLQRLEDGEAQVAFIQGGILQMRDDVPDAIEEATIQSLGSLFPEPIWVFHRGEKPLARLADLAGKRIGIGPEGSGVRQVALQLLAANDIKDSPGFLPLSGSPGAEALRQGKIDALFVVAALEAPVVQDLLRTPGIRLLDFAQADAYRNRFPFLSRLTLPQGSVDLVRNQPANDVNLLAVNANLIASRDLHPALQSLLLQAAKEVHSKAGFFQRAGEYPAPKDQSVPLSPTARRFYESGPPFLQRYLPFWLAVLIDRLMVLLLPIVALLIPLLKVAPAIYAWRVKSKIFRVYGELKFLENDLKHHFEPEREAEYRTRLDQIEEEAAEMHVPLAFTDLIYTLREHVNLVRRTLNRLAGDGREDTAESAI